MSVLPAFDLVRPTSVDEALDVISEDAVPYAGGTELLLAMRAGLLRPSRLVDLKAIPELAAVAGDGDGSLAIGGTATHSSVSRHPDVMSAFPVLSEVLEEVGNPRVRSAGTVAGNLCFAEPKSDVAPILIALGAEVTLRSAGGERSVPVSDLCVGPYTTVREESEILTKVSVPDPGGSRVVYEKFQTMERPTVGVAAARDVDGSLTLVVGAVGPTPAVMEFSRVDDADPGEVAASVEVIPDLTGDERYKRHITAVTVSKTLQRLGDLS